MSSLTDPVRGRRGASRGTATVEAVVALPVLVLLFIGAFYLHDLTKAKSAALTQARTCAWLYSANNCSKEDLPAECTGVVSDPSAISWSNPELEGKKDALGGIGRGVGSFLTAVLQPVLDAVFGEAASAHVSRVVHQPSIFGGSTMATTGNYRIACNVSETTLKTVAGDAWASMKDALHL